MGYPHLLHLEPLLKKWWKHFLLGLLFVLLAVWIFLTPLASYMSLSLVLVLALILTGLFEVTATLLYRRETKRWVFHLIGGLLELVIGGYLLINPVTTMNLLPYLVAFWLFYKSGKALWVSLRLKSYAVKGWGWILAMGIGTLVFTALVLVFPVLGELSIVYTVSLAFLALGMFHFSMAHRLWQLRKPKQEPSSPASP